MPIGFRGPLAQTRQAQYQLLRQRAFLQQTVHQTTHALARFFLEVDSNYKLLKSAGRLREAAEHRLEAQRAFYEEGTINIDRYLDAVNRWSNAVAHEAQFRTSYNTAIAALEEAKGTLLAYNNIAVAEGPHAAEGLRPGERPAAGPPQAADPAGRPAEPEPDRRPAGLRPGRADAAARRGPALEPSPDFPAPFGLGVPRSQPLAPTIPAGDPTPLTFRGPAGPGRTRARPRRTRRPRPGRRPRRRRGDAAGRLGADARPGLGPAAGPAVAVAAGGRPGRRAGLGLGAADQPDPADRPAAPAARHLRRPAPPGIGPATRGPGPRDGRGPVVVGGPARRPSGPFVTC